MLVTLRIARKMTYLPYLSVLKLSGTDVTSFLQGQLTADILALGPGAATFAAYCSPRGQVIATVMVCRSGEDWFMVLAANLADAILTRLKMYVLRAKVIIDHCPELQAAGLMPLEHPLEDARAFSPPGTTLHYLLRTPQLSAGHEVLAWRRHEICHGLAWLDTASSERFLPQMLGLGALGALSFSKGCYTGQEIVARTHYLGKLKRHPLLLQLEGRPDLRAGDSCFVLGNAQEVEAVVVELTCFPDQPCVALLVAALKDADAVSALRSGDRSWPAQRLQACATT